LTDIAEHLERVLKDKEDLEQSLSEVRLERDRLQAQVAESSREAQANRRQAVPLATKEKLLRDEFERRILAIQLELKKERNILHQRLERMKIERAGCICQRKV
jgi:hypothetical protein